MGDNVGAVSPDAGIGKYVPSAQGRPYVPSSRTATEARSIHFITNPVLFEVGVAANKALEQIGQEAVSDHDVLVELQGSCRDFTSNIRTVLEDMETAPQRVSPHLQKRIDLIRQQEAKLGTPPAEIEKKVNFAIKLFGGADIAVEHGEKIERLRAEMQKGGAHLKEALDKQIGELEQDQIFNEKTYRAAELAVILGIIAIIFLVNTIFNGHATGNNFFNAELAVGLAGALASHVFFLVREERALAKNKQAIEQLERYEDAIDDLNKALNKLDDLKL